MRYVVYGDIHGCLEEWEELRRFVPKNSIEICVGDILDKGPFSIEALRYARKNKILSVLGNHEFKHLRKWWGRNVILDENQKEVYSQLRKEDFEYLQSMPFFFKLNHLTILHAGITNRLHLNNLSFSKLKNLLYIREIDEEENPLPLHHGNNYATFWTEKYTGREGFIVYGHTPFLEIRREFYSVGIDTGVVYGNKLTALIISDTLKPWEFEVIQVKAKHRYTEPLRELTLPTCHSFSGEKRN
ncbi:MAG: protein phosphatase [Epsilonproteobacteria bacterium]|nr:protein phosphatase [Campylobacterota bacterium]NPA88812.1 protein phosphatase [Campylobacterota bacterium]